MAFVASSFMTSFPYTNISVYLVRYLLWGQLRILIALQERALLGGEGESQSSTGSGEHDSTAGVGSSWVHSGYVYICLE